MCIYSVVNMENIKLYEPSMLDWETKEHVLPTIEELALEAHEKLVENIVLQKKSRNNRQGQHDLWKTGLKGKLLGKEKWYSTEKVEKQFLHLLQKIIEDQNPP
jgi:hypothetical protein